ncbi:hypothetical protein BSLG_003308 [Batrachochytrium salamandrivorans]|nr:hypothetical protein BSLG_003308 [Batrachochytrium salamandrivorans]
MLAYSPHEQSVNASPSTTPLTSVASKKAVTQDQQHGVNIKQTQISFRKTRTLHRSFSSISSSKCAVAVQPINTVTARRKVVVLGDGSVGKTSLLASLKQDSSQRLLTGIEWALCVPMSSYCMDFTDIQDYVPTVFENVVLPIELDGVIDTDTLVCGNGGSGSAVWDTAGQDDYARLRPLAYPDTDAFIMCFGIDSPDSFKNIQAKWLPEINHYSPHTPILLIGLKSDLRDDPGYCGGNHEAEEAEKLVNMGLVSHYRECSALKIRGVKDVIGAAARLAMTPRRRKSKAACTIL